MKGPKLKIDHDLIRLTSPLDAQRYLELEKLIVNRYCTYPIYTWNDHVLYDETCYKIYKKHRMFYKTIEVPLKSKNEAISWICDRTLEAVDLPIPYRKYLIGKKYLAEAEEGVDSAFVEEQYKDIDYNRSRHYGKLMVLISGRFNIGPAAIKHIIRYTKAVDRLYDINTTYVSAIMNEYIKVSMKDVISLAALPDTDIKKKTNEELGDLLHNRHRSPPDRKKESSKKLKKVTVKDMPVYDPDSYVSSLSLTIPSWICSIKRTGENSNAENISVQARSNLINALTDLITISSIAREALEA